MASQAYQNNGAIILWWDESETDGITGDNADAFDHTVPEIIISEHAHKNDHGKSLCQHCQLTHSSDLKTMAGDLPPGPSVGDAANATDLSDLFQPGAVPKRSSSLRLPHCCPFLRIGAETLLRKGLCVFLSSPFLPISLDERTAPL